MIYTLTLNPSIDYIMHINEFEDGKTIRSLEEAKYPGGKGIMVSKLLKNLDEESINLGFIGGFTGDFIANSLKEMDIKEDFVRVSDDTRINVKLKYQNETEVNAGGPQISNEEAERLLRQINSLEENSILIMSGSAPRSLGNDYYKKILENRDHNFTLDISGKEILDYLKYEPILVKPNKDELSDIFDVEINSDNIRYYAKKLNDLGAKNVIISMGSEGSIFIDDKECLKAYPIDGELINSVGAGDSMVGGFIFGISHGLSKLESYKLAVACGTATAFSKDIASKGKIEEILKEVKVEEYGN